jgi:DNA-binding PadR family transcriptional regulator
MSSSNHSFSPLVAAIVGVKKAVVLQHFEFLQESFITQNVPIKKVWVRRSVKALTTTYPYMSPKEIRGCLDGLVSDGYLNTIVNNGSSTDHTKSYQLTEKAWNLIGQPKDHSDLPVEAKGLPSGANRLHKRANLNMVSSNQFIIKTTTAKSVVVVDASLSNLEEKEIPPTPIAPTPAPRRFEPFNIDTATAELKENEFSAENFARITGTPASQMFARFSSEVDAFVLEQKGRKTVYNRFDEFSGHFFNWSRSRVRARTQPGASAPQPTHSNIPSALQGLIGK